jgi:hypothetical protein
MAVELSISGVSAASASAPRGELSVAEALNELDELAGQTVSVRGWMSSCSRESCGLFSSARQARRGVVDGFALPLRPDEDFLGHTSDRQVRQVVIQARVAVTCRNRTEANGDSVICLEHGGHLIPLRRARVIGH